MMSTHSKKSPDYSPAAPLTSGDRMTRAQFHPAYKQMGEGYRAELIGGIVYEPSPLRLSHGKDHLRLGMIFDTYAARTPGVEAADNATVILGAEDEVQPDLILRITPGCGGQSHTTASDYIEGAPELVAEIADSSKAIDLHLKKERYAQAGVVEYIVMCLRPRRLLWFALQEQKELSTDARGLICSGVFPGLWIDREALIQQSYDRTMEALNSGLNSHEHKQFVVRLTGA
jgi:Uma2 family endonuclease